MFLEKFKEFPKNKTLIIATILSAIPFLVLTIVFCVNEVRLMASAGYGVLDFELAWAPETINQIFTAWGPIEMQTQVFITYIDYLFIFCYSLFGVECAIILSRKSEGKLRELGLWMILMFILAGVWDALENINLLIMLFNEASFSPLNPFFASLFATFKISFLVAGLCYLFIATVHVVIKKKLFLNLTLIGGGILLVILLALWNILISLIAVGIYTALLCFIFFKMDEEN